MKQNNILWIMLALIIGFFVGYFAHQKSPINSTQSGAASGLATLSPVQSVTITRLPPVVNVGSSSQCMFVTDGQSSIVKQLTLSGSPINQWPTGFDEPYGITVSPSGVVFVTSSDSSKPVIGEFAASTGSPLGQLTTGISDGFMSAGISVGTNGYVYATYDGNSFNGYVGVFNSIGTFLGNSLKWNSNFRPIGIATAPSGNIYLVGETSSTTGNIMEFAPNGSSIINWNTSQLPTFLAVAPSGNIYITEGNEYIEEFNFDGSKSLAKWKSNYGHPVGIAIDASGNVYVTDINKYIEEFSSSGASIAQWGGFNDLLGIAIGPCAFKSPTHV